MSFFLKKHDLVTENKVPYNDENDLGEISFVIGAFIFQKYWIENKTKFVLWISYFLFGFYLILK